MNIEVTVENTNRIVVTVDTPNIKAVFDNFDDVARFIQALLIHVKTF